MSAQTKVERLVKGRSYHKWDVDFAHCARLFEEFPDFFSDGEKQYVAARLESDAPLNQIRQRLGRFGDGVSSRTLWDTQKLLFWKYHYILYLKTLDLLDVVVREQIIPILSDPTPK